MTSKYYLVGMTASTMMVSVQSLFPDPHKTAHTHIKSQMKEGKNGALPLTAKLLATVGFSWRESCHFQMRT